ncbi:MAG: hypothetical protein AAF512_19265 [Pseudomonadota bacterium]
MTFCIVWALILRNHHRLMNGTRYLAPLSDLKTLIDLGTKQPTLRRVFDYRQVGQTHDDAKVFWRPQLAEVLLAPTCSFGKAHYPGTLLGCCKFSFMGG